MKTGSKNQYFGHFRPFLVKINNFDLQEFSIKRFYKPEMKKFWNLVHGSQNTLRVREQATV